MKKAIALFLIIWTVFCTGCTATPPTDAESSDASAYRQQDRGYGFVETEQFYYSLVNEKVYFSEKDEPCFYLLCGKADCKHGDANCNAYAGYALGYWNGSLYGADTENLCVIRMAPNGESHTQIARLKAPIGSDGSAGGLYDFYFHENHLFYTVSWSGDFFYQVDLDTGETAEILTEWSGEVNPASRIRIETFYQDYLLFSLIDQRTEEYTLYKYGISDGVSTQLCPWDKYFFPCMEDDTLYYYDKYQQSFAEYRLTTGETTYPAAAEIPNYWSAYYDADRIYVVADVETDTGLQRAFSVYDRAYRLMATLQLRASTDYYFAGSKSLLFSAFSSGKLTGYIPVERLKTGELTLLEVTDPYALR